jgi:hypothetical protein
MRPPIVTVLVAYLLVAVGALGLRATVTAAPELSEQAAAKLALQKAATDHPQVTGVKVVYSHFEPVPWAVRDSGGALRFSESKSGCPWLGSQLPSVLCPPAPVWAVELTAPAQGPWRSYEGFYLVDARTGDFHLESFSSSN